jgi:hypothetical protein
MGPCRYFPGEISPREESGGLVRQDLRLRGRLPESLSRSCVGSDTAENCLVVVLQSKLEEPGRRIGQRGDATRAPSQGPRPGWAAGRRPSASRDWPKSDKSLDSSCNQPLDGQAPSFSAWPLNRHTMRYTCSGVATKREFLPTVKPEEPEILDDLLTDSALFIQQSDNILFVHGRLLVPGSLPAIPKITNPNS